MEHVLVEDIVRVTGGKLVSGDALTVVKHISIDSRQMQGDDIFVPIIGEHNDAHDFIPQAIKNGAVAVFFSNGMQPLETGAWIAVDDTVKALKALGEWYRSKITIPVVGITGSVGKTTTREMVAAALSGSLRVYKTTKNFNSQIGVPMTVCGMSSKDEAAVLELGISEFGEMEVISGIARPTVAIFTNIGITHIEQLESRENILDEKWHITDYLPEDGVIIANGDNDLLQTIKSRTGKRVLFFGLGTENDVRPEALSYKKGFAQFDVSGLSQPVRVSLSVQGEHMVLNALAALCAADVLGLNLIKAAEKLKEFRGYSGRQNIVTVAGVTVIDDAYNASPDSMKAALSVLKQMLGTRKLAVLAGMNELGPRTREYHYKTGVFASESSLTELITVGDMAREIARAVIERSPEVVVSSFDNNEEATDYLIDRLKPGDTLLLKGSNSMRLKEILQKLEERLP